MTAMEGKWTSTSFMALEMKLLYDLIKLIKNGHPYDWLASIRNCIIRLTIISFVSLGVLGRFSTKDDSEEYELPTNNIFWLPTDDGNKAWYTVLLPGLMEFP